MKSLIGIANNNQYTILSSLKRCKYKGKIQTLDGIILGCSNSDIILVPGIRLFMQNIKQLNECNATVFIFDNPVVCSYLSPIRILDIEKKKKELYTYSFRTLTDNDIINSLQYSNTDTVVSSKIDIVPTFLNATLESALAGITIFLAHTKDTKLRAEQQRIIFKWLEGKTSFKSLKTDLYAVIRPKTDTPTQKLNVYFNTTIGLNFRKAMREIKIDSLNGKLIRYDKLETKYRISAFDMKYANSVLSSNKV